MSGNPDDSKRRFVFTYFLQDQTVKIEEKPMRNSGFVGGVFLTRREIKLENGETLTEKKLYLGAVVSVFNHKFRLLETNEGTLKWMEDKASYLSWANYAQIVEKLRAFETIYRDACDGNLQNIFIQHKSRNRSSYIKQVGGNNIDDGENIMISMETLTSVLKAYNALEDGTDNVDQTLNNLQGYHLLSPHEVVTIIRTLEGESGKKIFNLKLLLRDIVDI